MSNALFSLAGTGLNELKKAASAAGLRYVSDHSPGITRIRTPNGFGYRHPDASKVTGEETLTRIRKLAIPPAYEEVWICCRPRLTHEGRVADAALATVASDRELTITTGSEMREDLLSAHTVTLHGQGSEVEVADAERIPGS